MARAAGHILFLVVFLSFFLAFSVFSCFFNGNANRLKYENGRVNIRVSIPGTRFYCAFLRCFSGRDSALLDPGHGTKNRCVPGLETAVIWSRSPGTLIYKKTVFDVEPK